MTHTYSFAAVVPAITSVAALSNYANANAFNATEHARVRSGSVTVNIIAVL